MAVLLAQTATGTSNLASTVITMANTTNGNTIVVFVGDTSLSAGDVSGITDTQGNTYVKVSATSTGTLGELEIWYTTQLGGIVGGANTITVAYTTGVSCAAIAREYWGILQANALDQQLATTGSSASASSGNVQLVQPIELLVGAAVGSGSAGFSAGAGFSNLTTLNDPLSSIVLAVEDQFVTSIGPWAATFSLTSGIWICAVASFYQLPHGTTTSTSFTTSTSSTSSSISSTSTTNSSTSTSISSTSTSFSSTSTSTSHSSTSISSTSSSTSSTSSSTSVSSTSTSISSTSTSSTSTSSTSSSTSISSTSTSLSSTSSSISSTSISISSTSSSTSSTSSSTSTTTLPPPYISYSYGQTANLPTPAASTGTAFNSRQYSEVSTTNGDYFVNTGTQYVLEQFNSTHTNNTDNINISWTGRSTEAPSISPIYLQVYNQNTVSWQTLASQTVIPVDTDFTLTASITTNVSNYYDSNNIVYCRVYQQVI